MTMNQLSKQLKTFLILSIFILFFSCNNEVTKEPSVSIEISNDGKILTNEDFTITAQISDNSSEVTSLDLYIDNALIKTIFTSPYVFNLNYNDISIGNHTVNIIFTLNDGQKLTASSNFDFIIKEGLYYQGGIIIEINSDSISGLIMSDEMLPGNGNRDGYYYGSTTRRYYANDEDDGLSNTNKLISGSDVSPSANACVQYSGGGYDDWYMPATNELIKASKYKNVFDITDDTDSRLSKCWSSTEVDRSYDNAYVVNLNSGVATSTDKANVYSLIAVRKF